MDNIPSWIIDYGWMILFAIASLGIISLKSIIGFRWVWALTAMQGVNVIFYLLQAQNPLEFFILSVIICIPIMFLFKRASDERALLEALKDNGNDTIC